MRLSKEERCTVVSTGALIVSVLLLATSLTIPVKRGFQQSAMIFPLIVTGIMTAISLLFLIASARKGRPGPKRLFEAGAAALAEPQTKNLLRSILIVAVYIFVGIPLLGYYLSSGGLILLVLLLYLRRLKPWVCVLVSAAMAALLYCVFALVFKIPIR